MTCDPEEILDWIDEALLVTSLPEGWQGLERIEISGATAVATLGRADAEADLKALAEKSGVDPIVLMDLAERFADDAQVALVGYLYQQQDMNRSDRGDLASSIAQQATASTPTTALHYSVNYEAAEHHGDPAG